jgi:hypothetical protein
MAVAAAGITEAAADDAEAEAVVDVVVETCSGADMGRREAGKSQQTQKAKHESWEMTSQKATKFAGLGPFSNGTGKLTRKSQRTILAGRRTTITKNNV